MTAPWLLKAAGRAIGAFVGAELNGKPAGAMLLDVAKAVREPIVEEFGGRAPSVKGSPAGELLEGLTRGALGMTDAPPRASKRPRRARAIPAPREPSAGDYSATANGVPVRVTVTEPTPGPPRRR